MNQLEKKTSRKSFGTIPARAAAAFKTDASETCLTWVWNTPATSLKQTARETTCETIGANHTSETQV